MTPAAGAAPESVRGAGPDAMRGTGASASVSAATHAAAAALLPSLWTKYLPLMRERLAVLDNAQASAALGAMSAEQRALAIDAAHKFAGSLGMFGYPQGTDAARAIEHHLLGEAAVDAALLHSWVTTLHTVLAL